MKVERWGEEMELKACRQMFPSPGPNSVPRYMILSIISCSQCYSSNVSNKVAVELVSYCIYSYTNIHLHLYWPLHAEKRPCHWIQSDVVEVETKLFRLNFFTLFFLHGTFFIVGFWFFFFVWVSGFGKKRARSWTGQSISTHSRSDEAFHCQFRLTIHQWHSILFTMSVRGS